MDEICSAAATTEELLTIFAKLEKLAKASQESESTDIAKIYKRRMMVEF